MSSIFPARLSIFEQLLRFRLFQGMSRSELQQLAGTTKFGFHKLQSGKRVVAAGEACRQLHFLVSGEVEVCTMADDGGYQMKERLAPPLVLQEEALFGRQPSFTVTATTLSPSSFITLSKDEVVRLTDEFLIFRLNLLNTLAARAQQTARHLWRRQPQELRGRLVRFVIDHCLYPAGPKELSILMTRLAQELCVSRLEVSRVLNDLQQEGLVSLHRGRIAIPLVEQLLM